MSDYFEKLGKLLNETLEEGKIPDSEFSENESENFVCENRISSNQEDFSKNKNINSDNQSSSSKTKPENQSKPEIFYLFRKNKIPVAEVIKNGNYSEYLNLPDEIKKSFFILGLNYPCSWKQVNKKYHHLLKAVHPDTRNKNSQKEIEASINELQVAYNKLKEFYSSSVNPSFR